MRYINTMATTNITTTIIPYNLIPVHIENGWVLVLFNPTTTAFRSSGDGSAVMTKQGTVQVRDTDGCEIGLIPKKEEVSADINAPLFRSANIATNGTTVTVVFNENVVVGVGGPRGMSIQTSAGYARLQFQNLNPANNKQAVYLAPVAIPASESSIKLTYNQPGAGLQDAAGNSVLTFVDQPVINNSTIGVGGLLASVREKGEPGVNFIETESLPGPPPPAPKKKRKWLRK
jgi:hypothetical protein